MKRFFVSLAIFAYMVAVTFSANAAITFNDTVQPGTNVLDDQDAEYVSIPGTNTPVTLSQSDLQNGQLTVGTTFTDLLTFTTDNGLALNSQGPYTLEAVGTFTVASITNQNQDANGYANITLTGNVSVYENQSQPITGSGTYSLGAGDPTTLLNTIQGTGGYSSTHLFDYTGIISSTGTTGVSASQVPYLLSALASTSLTSKTPSFAGTLYLSGSNPSYSGYVPSSLGVSVTVGADKNQNGAYTNYPNNASPGPMLLASHTIATYVTPEPSSALICLGLAGVAGVGRLRRRWAARA